MLKRCRALIGQYRYNYPTYEKHYFSPVGKVLNQHQTVFPSGQYFIAKEYEYRGIILFDQKLTLITDDNKNGTNEVFYEIFLP